VGSAQLKMTYATAQSYMHIVYPDKTKIYLLSVMNSKSADHKNIIAKIAETLATTYLDYDIMSWEATKKKALEIRASLL
jgi:hypothetical protein